MDRARTRVISLRFDLRRHSIWPFQCIPTSNYVGLKHEELSLSLLMLSEMRKLKQRLAQLIQIAQKMNGFKSFKILCIESEVG